MGFHAAGMAVAALVVCLSGCEEEWKTIRCFQLGDDVYVRKFYTPEYYTDFANRLEAQAHYLYDSGDLQESLECFTQLREKDQLHRGASMIGIILTRMGRYEEAETWLTIGIEEARDRDWAWGAFIWHCCERGEYGAAEEAAKRLTGMSASTRAWNALKTVRGMQKEAETREQWERWGPWIAIPVVALLVVLALRLRGRRRRQLERERESHVRRMESELRALHVQTSLSVDQVNARLLEERAKSNAASFLHKLVVDGHLAASENSLKGIRGLMAIYRASLEALDKLHIDDKDKERRRLEMENAFKEMVQKLSGGPDAAKPQGGRAQ